MGSAGRRVRLFDLEPGPFDASIVRFLVGQDEERGARPPQPEAARQRRRCSRPAPRRRSSSARSIDDVPIMALTLWGARYDDLRLRQMAGAAARGAQGSARRLRGDAHRRPAARSDGDARSRGAGLLRPRSAAAVEWQALPCAQRPRSRRAPASRATTSTPARERRRGRVAERSRAVVVGASRRPPGAPRRCRRRRRDGGEPTRLRHALSPRARRRRPAVTLSIAKRKGTNAIDVARAVERKLELVRGTCCRPTCTSPSRATTARRPREKSNELLWHMLLAVLSVSALIWLVLGRREAAVVLIAIPVTLALTLFVFYLYGYTLNRITLFALIFSIGILVDDAIVVVENIVRHARMSATATGIVRRDRGAGRRRSREPDHPGDAGRHRGDSADGVRRRADGPLHAADPGRRVGGDGVLALVAFVVTPWAAVRLLRPGAGRTTTHAEDRLTRALPARHGPAHRTTGRARAAFLAGVALCCCSPRRARAADARHGEDAAVRQQERVPGHRRTCRRARALETTARVAAALADATLRGSGRSRTCRRYAGTSAPYNFNGLVRHYFLRQAPHLADLQVNLLPKDERREQSHAIAQRLRDAARADRTRRSARASRWPRCRRARRCCRRSSPKSTGRCRPRACALAGKCADSSQQTPGVVDTDWYVESPQPKRHARGGSRARSRRRRVRRARRRGGQHGRARGGRPDCCTIAKRAKTSRSSSGCRATAATDLGRLAALPVRGRTDRHRR